MKRVAAGVVAVLAAFSTGCATTQAPAVLAERVSAQTTRQVLAQHVLFGRDATAFHSSRCSIGWFSNGMDRGDSGCSSNIPLYDSHTYIETYIQEQQRLNDPKF
jgi:hypothetical protein